jgi:hypothetical protein
MFGVDFEARAMSIRVTIWFENTHLSPFTILPRFKGDHEIGGFSSAWSEVCNAVDFCRPKIRFDTGRILLPHRLETHTNIMMYGHMPSIVDRDNVNTLLFYEGQYKCFVGCQDVVIMNYIYSLRILFGQPRFLIHHLLSLNSFRIDLFWALRTRDTT